MKEWFLFFLCSGKPDKIKRGYLYNDYSYGGLNLLSLRALNFALKASLVPKFNSNPQWFSAKLLTTFHPLFHKQLYLYFQLNASQFALLKRKAFPYLSDFLEEVIVSWLQYQYHQPELSHEIRSQLLWYNSNIMINNMSFFIESMFTVCLLSVNDLSNSKGEIMSYNELTAIYSNVCDSLTYDQLWAAIPQAWKRKLSLSSKQLVCCPAIKDRTWVNKRKINKKKI